MRALFFAIGLPIMTALAATDPAGAGAFTAAMQTVSIPGTAGATLSTDVFFPRNASGGVEAAAKPCPVIVLGHGFSQAKSNHTNQGLHWASRGYVVLIPNLAGGSDHSRNADDLSKCIDWIIARHGDAASPFFSAIRTGRIGVTGHSAGGLSSLVAATRDPRIRAVAPMDPVDNNSLGVNALPGLGVAVAITYSEPSLCNSSGSASALYAAAPPQKRGLKIIGANHTDPQDPAGVLSIITCGAASTARQMLYRRYVTGWLEYFLKGDESYAPWVFDLAGGQTAADLAANRITYARTPPVSAVAQWRATHFGVNAGTPGIAGPAADPDGDQIANLVEYALALDPLAPSAGGLPSASVVTVTGDGYLAITFPRATMATDATVAVEVSADLATWTPGSTYSAAGSTPDTAATTEVAHTGLGIETITVRDKTPLAAAPRFMRLRVTLP